MNIETREVRDYEKLSEQERESGLWIKSPKAYKPKTPVSDADYERMLRAEAKRHRKQAARIEAALAAVPSAREAREI